LLVAQLQRQRFTVVCHFVNKFLLVLILEVLGVNFFNQNLTSALFEEIHFGRTEVERALILFFVSCFAFAAFVEADFFLVFSAV
jgi:hypothetical protein